jgi:hypothetical protein
MDTATQNAILEIMKHITVLNDDYTRQATLIAVLTERVDWLCKFFWAVFGTVLATLATNVWQLFKMHKR